MRRLFFAVERIECRAVDQVDIEPAIVVVVDQANARAVGLDNEVLLRRAHLVGPAGEPRLFGDVFEDHRALVDEAARGDGPLLLVVPGLAPRPPAMPLIPPFSGAGACRGCGCWAGCLGSACCEIPTAVQTKNTINARKTTSRRRKDSATSTGLQCIALTQRAATQSAALT